MANIASPAHFDHAQLDQIPNMIWSKVLYFSHDDMIVLESQGRRLMVKGRMRCE